MTKVNGTSSNVDIFRKLLTQWIGRRKITIQYYCTPRMCRIPKCASIKNCLALRFSKRYNESAKKHLVCTNSLLSSVQAFIMSVTLLLQKSCNVKEFSVLISGAMIDDVGLNPYGHWASFHCQEFEQAVAWMEGDQIPA